MVVLIQIKNGNTKKAFVRNQVFYEMDENNRKGEAITSANIVSVFWLNEKKEMKPMPIKQFIEIAEEKNYWQ